MPITVNCNIFQYDPNDILNNHICVNGDENNSNYNPKYYNISWFSMSYKKIKWYKTNTVNNLASVLCAPFDALKWAIVVGTNIVIVPAQVIFHSPVVIYCTFYNSLRYLDDYLVRKNEPVPAM